MGTAIDTIGRQGKIEWVHARHEEVTALATGREAHCAAIGGSSRPPRVEATLVAR
jgi:hypothetical protein